MITQTDLTDCEEPKDSSGTRRSWRRVHWPHFVPYTCTAGRHYQHSNALTEAASTKSTSSLSTNHQKLCPVAGVAWEFSYETTRSVHETASHGTNGNRSNSRARGRCMNDDLITSTAVEHRGMVDIQCLCVRHACNQVTIQRIGVFRT